MTSGEDTKTLSIQADEAGDKFVKLYYETFDTRRHMVNKFYMDASSLLWNGNVTNGVEPITTFLENLPSSKHTLEALDVQPIVAVPGQKSMLVAASGTVKYQDKKLKGFMQNFILTAQGTSWKVVSDSFRTFE